MHAAEGGGLRDGPAVGAVDGVEGEVLGRTPEVLGGVAVEPAGVDGDVAVEGRVVRLEAEPRDRGVEADLGVDVVVGARLEHQGVAPRAELRGLLLLEDRVDLGLDVRRRGVEDQHVGAEVATAGDLRVTAARRAEHLELPEGVPVSGGPRGAGQPDVAGGPGDVEGLCAPGAGGGGVGGAPVGVVRGELDPVRRGVGGLPAQHDLAHRSGGSEVDLDPLRIGEGARPACPVVPVDRRGGGRAVVLLAGRRDRPPLGEESRRGARGGLGDQGQE